VIGVAAPENRESNEHNDEGNEHNDEGDGDEDEGAKSAAFERKEDDNDEDEDEYNDSSSAFDDEEGASNDKYVDTFSDMTHARSTSAESQYFALRKGFIDEAGIIGFSGKKPVYLNIHAPFCILATGLPGEGKSHTVNCILESCLLPNFNAKKPMSALVCHYDKNGGDNSICESIGLVVRRKKFGACLPTTKVVVLCSPTNLRQTKSLYHKIDQTIDVKALRFRWDDLGARQIMKLMRLEDSARQLYVSVLLEKLRQYYDTNTMPSLTKFIDNACEGLDDRQACPVRIIYFLYKSSKILIYMTFLPFVPLSKALSRLLTGFQTAKLILFSH